MIYFIHFQINQIYQMIIDRHHASINHSFNFFDFIFLIVLIIFLTILLIIINLSD